jgi:hypothetical protein
MDDRQFDSLARALVAATTTRRRVLAAGVLSGVLGMPGLFDTVAKKHKKRRKKIQRNAFGCVNVGSFCKNSGQCCSGVCQGKKGKKSARRMTPAGARPGSAGPCAVARKSLAQRRWASTASAIQPPATRVSAPRLVSAVSAHEMPIAEPTSDRRRRASSARIVQTGRPAPLPTTSSRAGSKSRTERSRILGTKGRRS